MKRNPAPRRQDAGQGPPGGNAVLYSRDSIYGIPAIAAVERSYSTSDLSRKSGDVIAEALRRPVTITQRNKPRLVLLNIEDYRRLRASADPRRAGRIETLPDDLLAEIEEAAEAYAREEEPGPS